MVKQTRQTQSMQASPLRYWGRFPNSRFSSRFKRQVVDTEGSCGATFFSPCWWGWLSCRSWTWLFMLPPIRWRSLGSSGACWWSCGPSHCWYRHVLEFHFLGRPPLLLVFWWCWSTWCWTWSSWQWKVLWMRADHGSHSLALSWSLWASQLAGAVCMWRMKCSPPPWGQCLRKRLAEAAASRKVPQVTAEIFTVLLSHFASGDGEVSVWRVKTQTNHATCYGLVVM